jgi:hypothetical protein
MRVEGAIVLPRRENDEGQRGDRLPRRENDEGQRGDRSTSERER